MIFLNKYQGALNAKKEALRLQEEEFRQSQRHRRVRRQETQLLFGSALFVVLIFFTGLGIGSVGTAVGLMNFLIEGVACKSSHTLCYSLRWDKSNMVLLNESSSTSKQNERKKSNYR